MNFDPQNMPKHVAIIMDGNGRWAKQKGKLRIFGHQNGVKAVRSAVSFAAKHHIQVLTPTHLAVRIGADQKLKFQL